MKTGPDGRFEFSPVREGKCRARGAAPGVISQITDVVYVPSEEATHFRVVLGRGLTISGRVVDDRGRGVPGADISVRKWVTDANAVADENGRFVVNGLEAGDHEVKATYGVLASKTYRGIQPGMEVEIVLERSARLTGTVQDAETGEPVERFRLYLEERKQRSSGKGIFFINQSGRFELNDLPPREYFFRLTAPGYVFHRSRVQLTSGETRTLDIALTRGEAITGIVVTRAGEPIEGAGVFSIRSEQVGQRIPRAGEGRGHYTDSLGSDGLPLHETFRNVDWADEVHTGPDGHFQIAGIAPGSVSLRVEHPSFLIRGTQNQRACHGPLLADESTDSLHFAGWSPTHRGPM